MADAKIPEQEFIQLSLDNNLKPSEIYKAVIEAGISINYHTVKKRVKRYKERGLLPLASGNQVEIGSRLAGTSTLYGPDGTIKQQWVKTDTKSEQYLENLQEAISEMAEEVLGKADRTYVEPIEYEDLINVYISNDVHFGALMWNEETGDRDWNLDIASEVLDQAFTHLVDSTRPAKVGIVVDLGDLMEVDDFKNMTPHSGNLLDVDSRYPKILKTAYMALISAIDKALTKNEVVHFINVAGNHDISTGHAVREIISAWYKNEPRVKVDNSPNNIKYFQYGETLLQFAHGDGLKMNRAGEAMAVDCQKIFSETKYRYSHFGHTHKDAVLDTPITRAESHRNLAPLNAWAAHAGFRGGLGTMKAISYTQDKGEVARVLYTV